MNTRLLMSPIAALHTVELTPDGAPELQRFFDANPAYFLATSGEPAGPREAHEEITGEVPPDWGFTKKWVVGYEDECGALVAMVNVISDLLAPSVWHIGTFIVATARHGSGDAQTLYRGVERWAAENGANWMRLGVVLGNTRAERFWRSQGYLPVRPRHGIQMGTRTSTVQNMVKPLAGGTLEQYFALVPRDRPDDASALEVRRAAAADRPALTRMLELYQHDLSDIWDQELDTNGEYGYALDRYWQDPDCHPFVALVGGHYAGFALVDAAVKVGRSGHWMDQFFVLKKHRRAGVGRAIALHVFAALPGDWEVGQMTSNLPAQVFWRRVIAERTQGAYTEQQLTSGWWRGVVQRFRCAA